MEPMDIKERAKLKSMQINNALGLFILFFGVVVVIAIPFSDNTFDKMTNLVAGVILVIIGLGMIIYAKRAIKAISKNTDSAD
jgi:FtsH-binding integral membrane protein